jgi:hypothetical protein
MFSVYVPGITVITSPETALFTAACMDSPGLTEISVAAPILGINIKVKNINKIAITLLIPIPPSTKEKQRNFVNYILFFIFKLVLTNYTNCVNLHSVPN